MATSRGASTLRPIAKMDGIIVRTTDHINETIEGQRAGIITGHTDGTDDAITQESRDYIGCPR